MMGMNYIHVTGTASRLAIDFQGEFWVFLVVAALFLILTFTLYYFKIRK